VPLMKHIPIDPARIRVLVAGPSSPATNQDGSPRTSREGQPLANLPVLVLADGHRPEPVTVRVPGPLNDFPMLMPIRLTGFAAMFWTLDNGRSGLTLTATAVQPEQPQRAGEQNGAR
jgi:hypothetical protein